MIDTNNKIRIIAKEAVEIRKELKNLYASEDINFDYSGLCNLASQMLAIKFKKRRFKTENVTTNIVHGEQAHTSLILSKYWDIQHTWLELDWSGEIFYIDITSQQFKWLYKDIPDYYISTIPPKWYLADKDNLYWIYFKENSLLTKLLSYNYKVIGPIKDLIYKIREYFK